jgi:hypothetical protein
MTAWFGRAMAVQRSGYLVPGFVAQVRSMWRYCHTQEIFAEAVMLSELSDRMTWGELGAIYDDHKHGR